MRPLTFPVMTFLALAACEPTVPDSASGVGFGDYNEYRYNQARQRAAREAQLSGRATVLPPEATGAPAAAVTPQSGISQADLAAAGIGPAQQQATTQPPAPYAPAPAPYVPAPAAPPLPPGGQPGLITPAPGAPLAATAEGAAFVSGAPVGPPPSASTVTPAPETAE